MTSSLKATLLLPLLPLHAVPHLLAARRPTEETGEANAAINNTKRVQNAVRDYGRPLSIIESSNSSSDDDEGDETVQEIDSVDNAASAHINIDAMPDEDHVAAMNNTKTIPDDWEAQVHLLFERNESNNASSTRIVSADAIGSARSITLKHLPRLLDDFEKQTGVVIILDPHVRKEIDIVAETNPEVILQPETMVLMMRQLYAARQDEHGDTIKLVAGTETDEADVSHELKDSQRIKYSNEEASDDSSFDSSSNEEGDEEDREKAEKTAKSREGDVGSTASVLAFPRSQSERADLPSVGSSGNETESDRRKKTSSDPSKPLPFHRRASAPIGGQQRSGNSSRQRAESSGDREVLKGKGKAKAPPSAWSRPKPQALANRDRNRRISGSSEASGSMDGELERDSTLSPTPSSPSYAKSTKTEEPLLEGGLLPRQRLSSQPELSEASKTHQIPRSVSSTSQGFVFPRATSSSDIEGYDAEASERWNVLVDDVRTSKGIMDEPMSPSLDEAAYYNFNPMSPTYNGERYVSRRSAGSRRSSGAGRRRGRDSIAGDETLTGEEQVFSLQAQLESVQRSLAEKDRSIEQMQRETEEYISRLQDEIEDVKSELSLRRKEDSLNRVRENIHLDNIASLEADLNKATSELETLRAQHARLRVDHDDLVVAMERHTARNSEYREQIEKAKIEAQEAAELEKQWEFDREQYRETIKTLNAELAELQQKLLGRDEDARVIASLQANVDSLNIDLEEARNRGTSHLLGSRTSSEADPTLSKRLGAELARSFSTHFEQDNEDDHEQIEGKVDADGDRSNDSVIVIHRRKRRSQPESSRTTLLIDANTQTESKQAEPGDETAPPTYDEARSEKDITSRLHPAWTTLRKPFRLGSGEAAKRYLDVAQSLDVRCTHMEERLQEDSLSNNVSIASSPWLARLATKAKKITRNPSVLKTELLIVQRVSGAQLVLLFLFGLLIGIAVLPLFFSSSSSIAYAESKEDWWMSNTLQVPWSGAHRAAGSDWHVEQQRWWSTRQAAPRAPT